MTDAAELGVLTLRPMADATPTTADPDLTALMALRVWTYKQGEVVSLMIHLGDRLGLYRAMADGAELGADDLAERTGLHPRWLLEWLRSQAAAELIETADGTRFRLSPEAASVLAEEDTSLFFAAGAFHGGVAPPEVVDRLAEAFRTGIGLSYDDLGPSAAHGVERQLAPWSKLALVPSILPRLDGVLDKLEAGAHVADVGCGAGVALLTLAEAFPASRFEGWDPSQHAVHRGRTSAVERGLDNVSFHVAEAAELHEEPTFDLVLSFDCLHDMTNPAGAAVAVRRALRSDGTWLIKEVKAGATWEQNRRNPVLAMMYGTSVATCMSSALSEPGGAGLGTLGLHAELLEQMCCDAGFTRFEVHDVGDPANLYFEVRP
jgi:SAM-dependent methyltransferase